MARKQVFFHEDIERERLAESLLSKCPRNGTELISIALSELADKYNLSSADPKAIKKFLSFYDFIKITPAPIPVNISETVIVPEPKPAIKKAEPIQNTSHALVNDDDREKLNDIMSMWKA